jgi:hypothetical protein
MLDGHLNAIGKILDDHPKVASAGAFALEKRKRFTAGIHCSFSEALLCVASKPGSMSRMRHNRAYRA